MYYITAPITARAPSVEIADYRLKLTPQKMKTYTELNVAEYFFKQKLPNQYLVNLRDYMKNLTLS